MKMLQKTKLQIMRANTQDMSNIAEIIRSSADWYRPFVAEKDMSEHDVDKKWEIENYKKREFWVGKNGNEETVGTVSLQYFNDTAYLGYVYLHADHTGRGYGKVLLDHAKQRAIEKNMEQMVLIAHPEADWAIKAYKRYGFKILFKNRADVLSWKNGLLKPYYEEGFYLFHYDLSHKAA
jgi:ribosomal protein S18 acetylase RimI-like enzyme